MKSPKRLADSDPNELNIGIRLYQKGIKKLEEKDRMLKDAKDKKDEMEVHGLDFKPQLWLRPRDKSNFSSVNVTTTQQTNAGGNKSLFREEGLIMYGKMIQEKKDKARMDVIAYQDAQYDYHPKINKKSVKII